MKTLTLKDKLTILAMFTLNTLAHIVLAAVCIVVILLMIFGGSVHVDIDFASFDKLLS